MDVADAERAAAEALAAMLDDGVTRPRRDWTGCLVEFGPPGWVTVRDFVGTTWVFRTRRGAPRRLH
jgi:hypothetical protein